MKNGKRKPKRRQTLRPRIFRWNLKESKEHEEQIRHVEEKLQLRLMEAELEGSSGETSDKSRPFIDTESDEEEPLKESADLHEDYDEYAENLKVHLPEVANPSNSFLKRRVVLVV